MQVSHCVDISRIGPGGLLKIESEGYLAREEAGGVIDGDALTKALHSVRRRDHDTS
jgi:hypothetical protein